ncbi:hypothetical protein Hanom_Chr14g01321951 [Helianthus anomalus]
MEQRKAKGEGLHASDREGFEYLMARGAIMMVSAHANGVLGNWGRVKN